jgi:hypothetical protein
VPAAGDLDRLGRSGAVALGVGPGAVTADHAGSRMRPEPVRDTARLPVGQHADHLPGGDTDQDGPVDVPLAQREIVRDDETGTNYSFDYADIGTEGFRAIRTGERVRFLNDSFDSSHAVYVIRVDLPDLEAYYEYRNRATGG